MFFKIIFNQRIIDLRRCVGFCQTATRISPMRAQLLSLVRPYVTLWTVACQAPLSIGFFDTNTGVGCYFLLQYGLFQCELLLLYLFIVKMDIQHSAQFSKKVKKKFKGEKKTFIATFRLVFNRTTGHHSPAQLIYKINHHRIHELKGISRHLFKTVQKENSQATTTANWV